MLMNLPNQFCKLITVTPYIFLHNCPSIFLQGVCINVKNYRVLLKIQKCNTISIDN